MQVSFSQVDSTLVAQRREGKLELILRFQDLRTIYDGKLISFLSDPDPIVRERAVRSFGSIQDTSVVPLLVEALSDRDTIVHRAAAFALGQTATLLSEKSRYILEHDLIWSRLERIPQGGTQDRLIEEIGKFGTVQALRDLILRFGTGYPLPHGAAMLMSISRFAIRGIVADEAVEYVLRFIRPPDSAPWQAAYALQRLGDHQQIRNQFEHVAQLYKNRDPLVRMYLVTLLGKIKDERTSLEPLQKLANYDGDWRVRVNALRALGSFSISGKPEIVLTFKRAFSDENVHVAITALSTLGNLDSGETGKSNPVNDETLGLLKRIAINEGGHYRWQLQGQAAIALAKLEGVKALAYIQQTSWPQRFLQYDMLIAMALTGAKHVREILMKYVDGDDTFLLRASLEAMQTLSHKNPDDTAILNGTYNACIKSLQRNDVAVVTTAASILGDSLFMRSTSVDPLLETLFQLRIPYDIEAMQEIVSALGKLKDRRAIEALEQFLRKPDRSVALATASALQSITGQNYLSQLSRSFEPLFTDFDFFFLRSLPDTISVRIETIRGNIGVELYKNVAPFTVMSFLKLARRGFYRGLTFHRVVPNFVVQGGDPRGDGWGGPDYSIRSEFSDLTYVEGALGIASAGKDTEGSQFFITQSPQPHLDGRYTLFGKVVSGMNVVNQLQIDDRIFDIR